MLRSLFQKGLVRTHFNDNQTACPDCKTSSLVKVISRHYLCLGSFPLIPLNKTSDALECSNCAEMHKTPPGKVDNTKVDVEAQLNQCLKEVLLEMIHTDTPMERAEIEFFLNLYAEVTHIQFHPNDIRIALEHHQSEAFCDSLRTSSGHLDAHAKELILKAALLMASTCGYPSRKDLDKWQGLAHLMGLTPLHIQGILQNTLQEMHSPNAMALAVPSHN